jgi:hypothetical protein
MGRNLSVCGGLADVHHSIRSLGCFLFRWPIVDAATRLFSLTEVGMTVRELIYALQGLVVGDDYGLGVADMEVWVNHYGESTGEAPIVGYLISDGRVWL